MSALKFLLQYVAKPRATGAVLPSSKYLARKMVAGADFGRAGCIVEYGPGTGVFTDEILRRRKPGARVLLLEKNPGFAAGLQKKYGGVENLAVVGDSAENVGLQLRAHSMPPADCIFSGLPFASLPRAVSEKILEATVRHLADGGVFVTFQYSLFFLDFISGYFGDFSKTREFRNFPPAYVLRFEKKAERGAHGHKA